MQGGSGIYCSGWLREAGTVHTLQLSYNNDSLDVNETAKIYEIFNSSSIFCSGDENMV